MKFSTVDYINAADSTYTSSDVLIVGFNPATHTDVYTGGKSTDNNSITGTVASARRKNRIWRTTFPRINDATKGDYRFRDYYTYMQMILRNGTNNYRMLLHNVITTYNINYYE
jgi:hypothetical protein